jgi:FAD/FMN-containing dehydrogenase
MTARRLLSWGNYPPYPQVPAAVHWRDELPAALERTKATHGTTLPYGSGLSYGDSCLAASDHVLDVRSLDRFISADWTAGRLVVEAGATLEDILRAAVPRGWFVSVTPGTKYVTVGGAIANDVHGKNHHRRGTFGRHVLRFGLLRSDIGRVICAPDVNPGLFSATIGGLGLTGVIEWAEIQLVPVKSSQIDGVTERFGSLAEFFAISAELDHAHEFCVSWVDCAARGRKSGRGVYMAGDFAMDGPLTLEATRRLAMPFTPPVSLINRYSLRAFNELYWRRHSQRRRFKRVSYGPFFYPLDALLKWNRIYGPNGFQQYQCLVPDGHAQLAMPLLLDAIARSGQGSFLAVLKRCGDVPSPGLLSFPGPGTTLALDFPQSDELTAGLFPRLDAIVREAGGRLYPAKDAHMSGEDFRYGYPEWRQLEQLRDPLLNSRFWQRVVA